MRSALAAVLLAILVFAPRAQAAPPVGGATFGGHSAQSKPVNLGISPDATQVLFYGFGGGYRCNRKGYRGASWGVGTATFGHQEPAIAIDPAGAFSKTFAFGTSLQTSYGRALGHGTGRFTFKGGFDLMSAPSQGYVYQTARGTLSARFSGRHGLRCTTRTIAWSAMTQAFAPSF
ncbi:MAG: hypothetical protein V7607_4278 [Solirubrobacteraceae bacterium]